MVRKTATKPRSVVLEPTERTTIMALSSQRQQAIAAVNVHLAELDAAMKSLQASYVQKYDLVEATEYRFMQEGDRLILECFEDKAPEKQEVAEDGGPEPD